MSILFTFTILSLVISTLATNTTTNNGTVPPDVVPTQYGICDERDHSLEGANKCVGLVAGAIVAAFIVVVFVCCMVDNFEACFEKIIPVRPPVMV